MRADRDDGPRRLNRGARNNSTKRAVIITAVLGGGLLLYLNGNGRDPTPSQVDSGHQENVVETERPAPSQPAQSVAVEAAPQPPRPTAEMTFWEHVERDRKRQATTVPPDPEREVVARQTTFNDTNYMPPKQVNIIQSVPVESTRRSTRTRAQGLSGSKAASILWEDARGNTSRWKTTFDFHNNRIDNSSFCLNLGKGSLSYRDCRKGAQQWLKGQCRSSGSISDEWRRMYCHAYSNFRT
ncbi:hypothetical protein [Halopseudomonas salina]|nr:hypothetical protein [Halopseudomonas salina]